MFAYFPSLLAKKPVLGSFAQVNFRQKLCCFLITRNEGNRCSALSGYSRVLSARLIFSLYAILSSFPLFLPLVLASNPGHASVHPSATYVPLPFNWGLDTALREPLQPAAICFLSQGTNSLGQILIRALGVLRKTQGTSPRRIIL